MKTAIQANNLLVILCAALVGAIVATVMARSPEKTAQASTAATSSPSPQPAAASDPAFALWGGLGSFPLMSDAQTRSISAENPTGEKGKGGMAILKPGV